MLVASLSMSTVVPIPEEATLVRGSYLRFSITKELDS